MFTINSQIVSRDTRLTKGARLLMGELISLSRMEFGCIAKDKTLASYIGVSTRSIQSYLNELKFYGYIEIDSKVETETERDSRIIVPTSKIILDIKKARKNYDKKNSKPLTQSSEWLDDYIEEIQNGK